MSGWPPFPVRVRVDNAHECGMWWYPGDWKTAMLDKPRVARGSDLVEMGESHTKRGGQVNAMTQPHGYVLEIVGDPSEDNVELKVPPEVIDNAEPGSVRGASVFDTGYGFSILVIGPMGQGQMQFPVLDKDTGNPDTTEHWVDLPKSVLGSLASAGTTLAYQLISVSGGTAAVFLLQSPQ